MVGVAQLVRAPDCGSGGRGFETRHSPHTSKLTTPTSFQKMGWTIPVGSMRYVPIAVERFIMGVKAKRVIVNFKSGSLLSKSKCNREC